VKELQVAELARVADELSSESQKYSVAPVEQ
jgi:hypothetical protein